MLNMSFRMHFSDYIMYTITSTLISTITSITYTIICTSSSNNKKSHSNTIYGHSGKKYNIISKIHLKYPSPITLSKNLAIGKIAYCS